MHIPLELSEAVASPFKRQRASLPGISGSLFTNETGFLPSSSLSNPSAKPDDQRAASTPDIKATTVKQEDSDEEL